MIRVRNIALSFMHPDEELSRALCRRLGVDRQELIGLTIAKKSIDARKKKRILFVYTLDVELRNESAVLERFACDTLISERPDQTYLMPPSPGSGTPAPVVVGRAHGERRRGGRGHRAPGARRWRASGFGGENRRERRGCDIGQGRAFRSSAGSATMLGRGSVRGGGRGGECFRCLGDRRGH
jgi:hypothetical protein